MNKYVDMLNRMLRSPDPESGGGGDAGASPGGDAGIYSSSGKGPSVVTKPGAGSDDGVAGGDEDTPEGGDGEDFTGSEEGNEDSEDSEDFTGSEEGSEGTPEDTEEQEGEETEEGQAAGKTKKGERTVKLDPETIAELRKQAAPAPVVKADESEAPMTKEQIQQLLNPVTVTEDTLKSLGFTEPTPEQVKGFQNFSNAIVKNAASIARVLIQQKEKQFNAIIEPMMAERETQRSEAVRGAFFKEFGHLKKYEKVMRAAANEVDPNNENGTPKSQKQIFKEVAARTIKTLADYGVTIKLPPKANLGAGGNLVPKPNAGLPPGRSGGGQVKSNKTNNPDADIYKRG